MRALFIVEDLTLAHAARTAVLAEWAREASWEVAVASGNNFPICNSSFHGKRLTLNARDPKEFGKLLQRGGILFPEDLLRSQLQEDLALMREFQPQVVLADMRPSAVVAGTMTTTPVITITNGYWSAESHHGEFPAPFCPFGRSCATIPPLGRFVAARWAAVMKRLLPQALVAQGEGISALRTSAGLAPYPDYISGFIGGDAALFCDHPMLCSVDTGTLGQHWIGPVPWSPKVTPPPWLSALPNNLPIAYLNLGSSGAGELVPVLLESLCSQGWVVIVGGGSNAPKISAEFRERVFWAPLLPGNRMVALSQLAITNGGSPSGYQALAQGVPVLGVPLNMDQLLFSTVLERFGAGATLRADAVSGRNVLAKLSTLSQQLPQLRARAQLLATRLQQQDTRAAFLMALRQVATAHPSRVVAQG